MISSFLSSFSQQTQMEINKRFSREFVEERLLYNKIVNLVKKPIMAEAQNISSLLKTKLKCTDLTYLLQRTKSNPKLMMEMITLYLEQTPPLISAMKNSFIDEDWGISTFV